MVDERCTYPLALRASIGNQLSAKFSERSTSFELLYSPLFC